MISKRILVIQTAFIGDVILATSVLETLHDGLPQAEIDFLVRKGNEPLLKGHPFIREVLTWDKKKGKYRHLWELLGLIRKKKYHYVINLQRYAATGLLTAMSGAHVRIGFDKNPLSYFFTHRIPHRMGDGRHEIERNYALLKPITDAPLQKSRLYPTNDDAKITANQHQPYLCIAPASVWFTKQFPLEKWKELIDLIPSSHTIYIVGAPADYELGERLIQGSEQRTIVNLCGKLSLLQSAALMRNAVMNFVNDSAPMHLCSAVDAPVTAIFCSTVPAFGYGPLSTISHIGQTDQPLSCRPCGLHGHRSCPEGHFKCALTIDVKKLAALIPQ